MQISSSLLSIYQECHVCGWLAANKKASRPRGKFPSLPNGMDSTFKRHYDIARLQMPIPQEFNHPELSGLDLFPQIETLKGWRQWNSKGALRVIKPKFTLVGGLDEVLYNRDTEVHVPLDYKTASKTERTQEEAEKYHQTQLDIYELMLSSNGYKTAGFGAIMLWAPRQMIYSSGIPAVIFETKIFIIKTDPLRALSLCEKAVACFEGKRPEPSADCEHCLFVQNHKVS